MDGSLFLFHVSFPRGGSCVQKSVGVLLLRTVGFIYSFSAMFAFQRLPTFYLLTSSLSMVFWGYRYFGNKLCIAFCYLESVPLS